MITDFLIGHGWTRYKSLVVVPPGEYYKLQGKPTDLLKKQLGLICAVNPTPKHRGDLIHWITPRAEWIRFVLLGMFVKEQAFYGKFQAKQIAAGMVGSPGTDGLTLDIERIESYFPGFDLRVLRPWQLQFLLDAIATLEAGMQYRRAAIVSLGGGKTLAGLLVASLGERAAVLAPRHVHSTWRGDAAKWSLPCPIVSTYESAHRIEAVDVLVLDEVLLTKNSDTLRAEKARALSKSASIVIALTGTPTSAGGVRDWRWLDCVRPGCYPTNETALQFLFSDKTELKEVRAGQKAYVTPASSWNTELVARYVSPFVMRVDTSELLAHLPPVTYSRIVTPQPKDWEIVTKGAATTHGPSKRVTQARMVADGFLLDDDGQVIRLDMNKINAVAEFVEGLGEPVVIFAAWRETIRALAEKLTDYKPAVVSGDTADIGYSLSRFLSGDTDVLILNAKMGSGVDGLQDRARVGIFVSNSASPVDRTQAEGRLFRSGQSRGVQLVDVVAEGSLDERQLELITGHNDLSESMVSKILLESL